MNWLHEDLTVDMEALADACEAHDPTDTILRVLDDGSMDRVPVRLIAYLLGAAILNQTADSEPESDLPKRLETHLLDEKELTDLAGDSELRDTFLSFARARLQENDPESSDIHAVIDTWEHQDFLVNLAEAYARAFKYAKMGIPVDKIPLDGIEEWDHEATRDFIRQKLREEQGERDEGLTGPNDTEKGT